MTSVYNLALAAIHARLAVTRIFEQLDLAGDAAKSMRTVTLEAAGLVEADAAVLTRLTAAVVPRVVLTETTFDARRTYTDEVAAGTASRRPSA